MTRLRRADNIAVAMLYGQTREQAEARFGKPVVRRKQTAREQPVVNAILTYLRTLPETFAFRVNTQGVPLHDGSGGWRPGPTTGVSDILCCHKGRFVALEVKEPRKPAKGSNAQETFLERIRAAGGIGHVVRSVEEVQVVMEGR